MKHLVILSGGLDSTTLLYDLVKRYGNINVIALSFHYGSKHNDFELAKAMKTCKKLKVKHKLSFIDQVFHNFESALLKGGEDIPEGHYEHKSMKKTVVPFRNGIFLSIASGLAESLKCQNVYYAAHGGDHAIYPDCREDFFNLIAQTVKAGTHNHINLKAPYLKMNKVSILKKGLKLGVDYKLTHTCYNPNEKGESCGKCGSCNERLECFVLNKTKDPITYQDK